MGKERVRTLTRGNVVLLGSSLLLLGGGCYGFFRIIGFEDISAGIWAESLLILLVFIWTASYILRVFTGKMTFVEQRKRYQSAYDQKTSDELQKRFESLSEEEQALLINDSKKESS